MRSIIKSVENFRELGDIKTADGRKIKKGYFYRSGALDKMTERDKKVFDSLNISVVVDLRDKSEVILHPDFLGDFTYINLPALKSLNNEFALPSDQNSFLSTITYEEMLKSKGLFSQSYEAMPFDNPAYKTLLNLLNNKKPILFHCASGKDRTGLGAAFISLSLGVDRDAVMKDYLLSNKYRIKNNAKFILGTAIKHKNKYATGLIKYIIFTREEFLNRSLDAIYAKYGDFETFLLKEYQIDKDTILDWRKFYLE